MANNCSWQIGVVINTFSVMICAAMIIYFMVLALLPAYNRSCLAILKYSEDFSIYAVIQYHNGTAVPVRVYYTPWEWQNYDNDQGLFASTIISLLGWVS